MSGLIPFSNPFKRKNTSLAHTATGFEDFYNMLDDFFRDGMMPSRSLLRDTFKIDIEERESEYLIEAELPGIKKEDIHLNIEDESLCITVDHSEEVSNEGKNYIHRERRVSSMSRRVRLADAKLDEIKAKLEEGVLSVTVPKETKTSTLRKIDIE